MKKRDEEITDTSGNDKSLAIYDPLTRYLVEVKKYPPLSPEEEFRLAVKFKKEGDKDAVYKLITSNLYLVIKISMGFRSAFQNLMDIVQEGNVGLMHAVKRFDPYKGTRLSTYATWWIRAYILKYVLDNWRLVKVGTTNDRRKLLYNLRKERAKLEAEGFMYETKLIAERLNTDEKDVVDVEKSLGNYDYSLDKSIGDSKKTYIGLLPDKRLKPDEIVESEQYINSIRGHINKFKLNLNEKERYILENRIISEDPLTLQEIGDKYSNSKEAIRKAENRIISKFKLYLKDQSISSYEE